ncbi:MAG TPA: hypothetical protein VGF60_16570 [Xanthobacteraceae bacterium]|jgi:hypothetical protein
MRTAHRGISFAPYPRGIIESLLVELVNRWDDREKQRFRCDFDLRTSRVIGLQLFPAPR